MSLRGLTKFALAALCLALPAFAQKAPAPGTHIAVSKNTGQDKDGMYTTIQAAVNAAQPGQVIEILDEEIYNEQVTIDGRDNAPWRGVTGGKNGITIRYVPSSSSVTARPTIRWRDTVNTSPKSSAEAKVPGDTLGSSGNFETNGAVRIIRANGVIIEGLIVDGVSPFTIAWQNVWCSGSCYPLVHGNAAIAVAVSGNIQIRDCQLKNAYFGIAVKDRNTGGVFGNPNPADNDNTIPLSGFGKTGSHLFEYNKIGDNNVGVYFESSWDRGSTVRYNLIYNNYYHGTTKPSGDDYSMGGIKFKDNYLSPVAIYNNTFYDNERNICGAWQVGAQHLVYNNIFSKVRDRFGQPSTGYHTMDGNLPYRMKHCIVSADDVITVANQGHICPPDNIFIQGVQMRNFGSLQGTPVAIQQCNSGQAPTPGTNNVVLPGAPITRAGNVTLPADANIRWLETVGYVATSTAGSVTLPDLFKSTNPASPNFLEPDWEHEQVQKFIRSQGWPAGTLNDDGAVPDLGAVQYTGKRPADGKVQFSRARISPFSVVTVTGTTATASILIDGEIGSFAGDLTIKYIRWIAPVPDNKDASGQNAKIIDLTMINEISGASAIKLSPGSNKVQFTLPKAVGKDSTDRYGFFEIVLQGTVNGKIVTTDVGFLPYRELTHVLDIKVSGSNVTTPPGGVPTVTAGQPVTLTVTAMERVPGGADKVFTITDPGTLQVDYSLLSSPTAKMYRGIDPLSNALTYEGNLTTGSAYTKTYTVYFTKAGDEMVSGAGLWCKGGDCESMSIVFLGTLNIIVKPGVPDKVVFLQPIPKSQLAGATPPTISGTYNVEVQVQDKFNNAVDVAVPVGIVSSDATIGDIDAPKTASTSAADGIARFTARVGNAKPNDIFDLYASISDPTVSKARDTASLRVGRVTDQLRVFFIDNGKNGTNWHDDYDLDDEYGYGYINALVGTSVPVWVKLLQNVGDTVITLPERNAFVCVSSADGLLFSAVEGGAGASEVVVPLTGGVAHFWVTSNVEVEDATISVSGRVAADCDGTKDNSMNDGSRGGVTFKQPVGGVGTAFVKGDGYGRPNYVEITFTGEGGGSFTAATGAWRQPDSVKLSWPGACAGVDGATAGKANIEVLDDVTIGVTFNPAAFPEGYTFPLGTGTGDLVTVYGAINLDVVTRNPTALIDSIGPLIGTVRPARCGAESFDPPKFDENTSPGVTPYVLRLQITEALADPQSLKGNSILISSTEGGDGETELTVTEAVYVGGVYTLTLALTDILRDGFWIRLNPQHSGMAITDNGGNTVHPENRRVQILQQETPPSIVSAYYTSADNTGVIDAVYITFDKGLTSADIPAWFSGGSFSFTWGGTGVFSVNADNIDRITVVPPGTNTIRVSLTQLEIERMTAGASGNIRTGGTIEITVKFNPGKGWKNKDGTDEWGITGVDKARPVLVRAVLQIGSMDESGAEQPDTLILTFSENTMDVNSLSTASPVGVFGGAWYLAAVKGTPVRASPSGLYYEAAYVVESIKRPDGSDPRNGDLVKINELSGIADEGGNAQDKADNHPVPLDIKPGKPNWNTKVKNNPFRDSVVVETTPRAKGIVGLDVVAQIKLYDNMGKMVVDTLVSNKPGAGGDDNAVKWVWKGRNKSGRYVGTGTYLFKAVYEVKNSDIERYQETKSIGYVRGKN